MAGAQLFPAAPALGPGGRILAAPFQFLLSGDEQLRVVSVNSLTGVTVAVQGYRLDPKGEKHELRHVHTPNTDRTAASSVFPLGPGALLNLTVFAASASPSIGETFVIVQLIRGLGAAVLVMGTLLAGFVTAVQPLGWPGSPIESSLSGPGALRKVTGTDPAAGAEISETVPTGARWELLTLRVNFATDTTAIDRRPILFLDDGSTKFFHSAASTVINASNNLDYIWAGGLPLATAVSGAAPLAGLVLGAVLLAGFRIRTTTQNIQAGDNYDNPVLMVREWLEAI